MLFRSGSTEGVQVWISPAGIPCDRENVEEWVSAIKDLDSEETYTTRSNQSRQHIKDMNLFTEASRIAGLVEQFVRDYPVKIQTPQQQQQQAEDQTPRQTAAKIVQPAGRVGFSNGRLRIQR